MVRRFTPLVVLIAACSGPSPESPEKQSTRDLELGTAVAPDQPAASALETGRAKPSVGTAVVARPRRSRPSPVAELLASAAPKLAVTATAAPEIRAITPEFKEAEQIDQVIAGPLPPSNTQPTISLAGGFHRSGGDGNWPTTRRPGVIIRGGMGGIDDDCDERHPRIGRPFAGPIAINNLAPRFPRGGPR